MISPLHEYSQKIANALMATGKGDMILYTALSKITPKWKNYISTARRIAEREIGAHFRPVQNTGYVRLTTEEKPMYCKSLRVAARRKNIRIVRCSETTIENSNDLSNETLTRLLRERAQAGLILSMTRD